jgi:uncharacterized protein (TIGR03437 family)
MKLWTLGALALLFALTAVAQDPQISIAVNGASYTDDIARGSIFVIKGSNLGPAALAQQSGLPWPTDLSGTRVTFTPAAGGAAIDARLIYTLNVQVAGLLPSATPAGDYDVRVIYSGRSSTAKRVKVVERHWGFFTANSAGNGPIQATYGGYNLNRFTTSTISFGGNTWELKPAKAGDTLVLWGTGLGADTQNDLTGQTSGDLKDSAQVRVIVGGVEIAPIYAGRSPGLVATDQINVTLPASTPTGCGVPIQVRAGGRTSSAGTIAVTTAGAQSCTHPSLSEAVLKRLDAGGTATWGLLFLNSLTTSLTIPVIGSTDVKIDSFTGMFMRYGPEVVSEAEGGAPAVTGQCFVSTTVANSTQLATGVSIPPVLLDAGPQLTLSGPNVSNKAVPRSAEKIYALDMGTTTNIPGLPGGGLPGLPGGGAGATPIVTGRYTVTGPGGADVAAFSASLDMTAAPNWTNRASITEVNRGRDLNVTWTGGVAGDYVAITGYSGTCVQNCSADQLQNAIIQAGVFSCAVEANRGSFTVPSSILSQLPASTGDLLSGSVGFLSLSTSTGETKGRFSPNLTSGGAFDFAIFNGSSVNGKNLAYR